MNRNFGQQLRALRRKNGLSQHDLASQVGVDFTYVSKIETGNAPPPSEDTIRNIARVLQDDENILLNTAGKVPNDLKGILKDNPLAVELIRVLSQQTLSDAVYQQLITLAQGSETINDTH